MRSHHLRRREHLNSIGFEDFMVLIYKALCRERQTQLSVSVAFDGRSIARYHFDFMRGARVYLTVSVQ